MNYHEKTKGRGGGGREKNCKKKRVEMGHVVWVRSLTTPSLKRFFPNSCIAK